MICFVLTRKKKMHDARNFCKICLDWQNSLKYGVIILKGLSHKFKFKLIFHFYVHCIPVRVLLRRRGYEVEGRVQGEAVMQD